MKNVGPKALATGTHFDHAADCRKLRRDSLKIAKKLKAAGFPVHRHGMHSGKLEKLAG
jgi:hypothetical protein